MTGHMVLQHLTLLKFEIMKRQEIPTDKSLINSDKKSVPWNCPATDKCMADVMDDCALQPDKVMAFVEDRSKKA